MTAKMVQATKIAFPARLLSLARDPIGAFKWRHERIRELIRDMVVKRAHRAVERAPIDPRISYPCYKSLDEFLDTDRLKGLDGYVTERIERHIRTLDDEKFYTGDLTLDLAGPKRPGSRIIYLSRNTRQSGANYYDADKADLWEPTEDAADFSRLVEFIHTLPFKRTARMIIMYDWIGSPVTAHRDHPRVDTCHEFIWFRTDLAKPFYMLNKRTGRRQDVESYSAWFDTCNQFHGVDAKPGLSVSIRVDGTFSDELRARIPVPPYNLASTAALWACIGDRKG